MHLLLLQAGNRRKKETTAGCCSQQMAIRSSRERAIGEHDALAGEISFSRPKTQYLSPFNTQPLHYGGGGGGGGMRIRLSAIARLARSATAARFIGTPYNKPPPNPASPAAVTEPEERKCIWFSSLPLNSRYCHLCEAVSTPAELHPPQSQDIVSKSRF